jgi:hypothetical protein
MSLTARLSPPATTALVAFGLSTTCRRCDGMLDGTNVIDMEQAALCPTHHKTWPICSTLCTSTNPKTRHLARRQAPSPINTTRSLLATDEVADVADARAA